MTKLKVSVLLLELVVIPMNNNNVYINSIDDYYIIYINLLTKIKISN